MRVTHELAHDGIGPPQQTCEVVGLSSSTSTFKLYSVGRLNSKKLRNVIRVLEAQAQIMEEFEAEAADSDQ